MKTRVFRSEQHTAHGVMAETVGRHGIEVLIWSDRGVVMLSPEDALEFAEQLTTPAKKQLDESRL